MSETEKLAVEIAVDAEGLAGAETRVKSRFGQHDGKRYELLSHARKVAHRRGDD